MAINSSNSACVALLLMCVIVCGASLEIDRVTIDDSEQNWSTFSPGDVRCYCNLPVCVATGYMCKSEGGGCFSEVVNEEQSPSSSRSMSPQSDVYKGRHGCLELLPDKEQRAECRNMPNKGSSKGHSKSILSCCFKDMCNHFESPETQTILNGTLLGINLGDSIGPSSANVQHEQNLAASPSYNSNEVWFKAAIIAVPICGAIILLLLIFLAVKILRTDTLSTSSKLGGPYVHPHDRKSNRDHFEHVHQGPGVCLKKVPLLLVQHQAQHEGLGGACTNHSAHDDLLRHTAVPLLVQNETGVSYTTEKKNEANAKLNTALGHEYNPAAHKDREVQHASPLLGLHKPLNITSSNNVYRNVNLSVTPTPAARAPADKLYEKQALSAVISWGAPSPSSSPV